MAANENSIEALRKLGKARSVDQERVFKQILKRGDKGLTSNEIEVIIEKIMPGKGRRSNSRTDELRAMGWIITSSKKRRNHNTGGTASIHIVPISVRKTGVPIAPKPKEMKSAVQLSVVHTMDGYAIYLNNKWLVGTKKTRTAEIIETWPVSTARLIKAMEAKTE